MHVKSVESSNVLRWGSVEVRRGSQLRCRPRHLTMLQNYEVHQKSPRVDEQCDVNIHSLGDAPRNFKPWSSDEDDA
ncbi:hypothetical protein TNCV_1995001 [Trichonephila clavipes]|nr:hypothetical protein TNCV_1995001 [Trichonephila clavipes]